MKSKMFKKLMAAAMATAMTASLAACGDKPVNEQTGDNKPSESKSEESKPQEEVSKYPVLKDANGQVYDLGGMEIIVRNWWSDAEGKRGEAKNKYEEDRYEYLDWCQETYNFTIKEQGIGDWGSAPKDFVDYASVPADNNNYIFTLRGCKDITSAMANGLMYDLSTLDCLDFTSEKFTRNKLAENYTYGPGIYAMYAGDPEPRTGMYFNKRLLKEAGIDPESLYELQKNDQWTWDKWEEMMVQVEEHFMVNGEKTVYGATANNGALPNPFCASNGTELVGKDADGHYVIKTQDPNTVAAITKFVDLMTNHFLNAGKNEDGTDEAWDHYKTKFTTGKAAFLPEDGYAGTTGNFLTTGDSAMVDDFGFVMFPKGPNGKLTNVYSNNPAVIPANYDADRAWKIAFAWNLYTDLVPGYTWTDGWTAAYYDGMRDVESVEQTAIPMSQNGVITYVDLLPNCDAGPEFLWSLYPNCDVTAALEKATDLWTKYAEDANKQIDSMK